MTSLSPPEERTLLHHRTVECHGYLRHDGDFDIEARVADRKAYDATMIDGRILEKGEPWHEMAMRLRVDRNFLILAAEARTIHGPQADCAAIATSYSRLAGLTIGPGFSSTVRALFSGPAGCTHITELLGPIATTAYQTISGHHLVDKGVEAWSAPEVRRMASTLIDSCHVWRADGSVVARHYPELARREK
jgi:Protein of unknown function (DUF2889)